MHSEIDGTDPTLTTFLQRLWQNYIAITPQALQIRSLLEQLGERIENDHVAFRTYDLQGISLVEMRTPYLAWGYEHSGDYLFPEKKLRACSLSHPSGHYPRVFLSELITGDCSSRTQELIRSLVSRIGTPPDIRDFMSGAFPWPRIALDDYEELAKESEYAAWVSAFGIRANHFTVSVNAFRSIGGIAELNNLLLEKGFRLNESGGTIKGGPQDMLEQSSTMADRIGWSFENNIIAEIPSCYVEFALRYYDDSGVLFDGFVPDSATRIFESTHRV